MPTTHSDWAFHAGITPRGEAANHDSRYGSLEPDADIVRRARLAVARASHDREDCQELLDMLGLLPGPLADHG